MPPERTRMLPPWALNNMAAYKKNLKTTLVCMPIEMQEEFHVDKKINVASHLDKELQAVNEG